MATPPDIVRALAAVTSEALIAAGFDRRTAAELSGIPVTTLQRRLTGRSPLNAHELDTLATLAGTTVGALVARAEQRAPAIAAHVGTSDHATHPPVGDQGSAERTSA